MIFLIVTGSLLLHNVILPSLTAKATSCPAIFADLNSSASGFVYAVGEPWFSPPQLVLAPGTTVTITLTYTSQLNNLSQLYRQPHGAFGFDYQYIFPVRSTNPLPANGTGIGISLAKASFPSVHEAIFILNVSAKASARQGAYSLGFPSTCGDTYYLVVGNLPYLLPVPGVLSPLALVVFDLLMGSLAVAVVHLALRLYDRASGKKDGSLGRWDILQGLWE